jgi:hypothetical protein
MSEEQKTCRLCNVDLHHEQGFGADGFCMNCQRERRVAWDRYAAAVFTSEDSNAPGSAIAADELLAERDQRFCRKPIAESTPVFD